jgi:hypothetical protein
MFRAILNYSFHRESHGHIHSGSVDKAIAILEIFTLAFVLWYTTKHDLRNDTQRSNVAVRRWLPSTLMYFRRCIITSKAKAFELVDIPCTTKVRNVEFPLVSQKMFSGFRSLCMMCIEWTYLTPSANWCIAMSTKGGPR